MFGSKETLFLGGSRNVPPHFISTLYVHEVFDSIGGLTFESRRLLPPLYWPLHAELSLSVSRDSKLVTSHWKVLTAERCLL